MTTKELLANAQQEAAYLKQQLAEEKAAVRKQTRLREDRIVADFKANLFERWEVTNHPKAEKVWSMAWDRSHSEGLHSVEMEFEELVDLIL